MITPSFFSRRAVAIALVLFGPLAIPLLWRSLEFSLKAKIVITLAALVLTLVFYVFTAPLLGALNEQIRYLKEIQSL